MLRFLIKLFLLPFIILIGLENMVRSGIAFIKKPFTRSKKHLSKTRKGTAIFSLRSKIKYFFFGFLFCLFFLCIPIIILFFLNDLPNPTELTYRQIPQTSKIFDRNGILLAEIYSTHNRTLIPLTDVPKHLQQATLAIEDKNFYNHPGFDIPSILRAFHADYRHGGVVQGGSTITQQLIKSSILTSEQSVTRKIKEVILAFWAEHIYTKQQILEMYFNQVPYGGTAWGVEAASETYFDKPVKQLSLAESAFLAGLTSAPTTYSPYGANPTLWKKRQKEVLNRMVAQHYITKKQAEEAAKVELTFRRQQGAIHAPHFINYIKELLIQKYGIAMVEKGGLQIKTSLDLKTQEMAEKIVEEEVANAASLNLTNGAAVVTDPKTGDILAMVGSHDFDDPNGGNVNLATSLRQPGSSIKPVTYAAALEHGFTAATVLDDSPVSYPSDSGTYSPVNYDGQFHGRVPLRIALANSFNITAVRTINQIGVPTMVDLAKKMGVSSWGNADNYGLAITLGSAEATMLDMATVYGTLANKGVRQDLDPILNISDAKGHMLEQKTASSGQRVLKPSTTFIMSDILADNAARSLEFGPNSPLLVPGHYVSVKTGTSDEKRDNWTDGYTDKNVVVVWVGNNDNTPMDPALASGITGAAPIWHRIMENLIKSNPEAKPVQPKDVIQKTCNGKKEYFLKGTECK